MSDTPVISLPVLPLRDIVVFPHMIVPLFVGREKSIKALEAVMAEDKQIILVTQKEAALEDPDASGLYGMGTIGTILQLLKLPDGAVKVLVEGGERVALNTDALQNENGYLVVDAEIAEQFGDMGAQIEAAMAALPPERNVADLSPEERSRMAQLLGVDAASLEDVVSPRVESDPQGE